MDQETELKIKWVSKQLFSFSKYFFAFSLLPISLNPPALAGSYHARKFSGKKIMVSDNSHLIQDQWPVYMELGDPM